MRDFTHIIYEKTISPAQFRRSLIPKPYQSVRLDQVHESCRASVTACLKNAPKSLTSARVIWIHGPYGAGKTSIACLLAKMALRWKMSVMFQDSLNYLHAAKKNALFEPDETMTNRALNVDLLILDDFRKETLLDRFFSPEHLVALFNERDLHQRTTIITSNSLPKSVLEGTTNISLFACICKHHVMLTMKGPNKRPSAEQLAATVFDEPPAITLVPTKELPQNDTGPRSTDGRIDYGRRKGNNPPGNTEGSGT